MLYEMQKEPSGSFSFLRAFLAKILVRAETYLKDAFR
jgi:hypothetical protein